MESIERLRKYANGPCVYKDQKRVLLEIAEAFEVEHAEAYAQAYDNGYDAGFASADDWLGQHEDAMAEHGWLKLPVDADGVPIRVGDEVEHRRHCVKSPATVDRMELREVCGHYFWTIRLGTGDESHGFSGCELRHHHEPTVEDVLWEFVAEFNRDDSELCDEEIIERFAEKLQLRGDGE